MCLFFLANSVGFGQGDNVRAVPDNPLRPAPKFGAFYIGPVIGYNKAMHSADLSTFAEDVLCPKFSDGSASGFHFGMFYEQFIGGISSQHSVVARILYNTLPASFTTEGDAYTSRLQDGNGNFIDVPSVTRNENKVVYNALSLDLMYKFRVIPIQDVGGLVLTVGPTFDYIIKKTNSQKYYLLTPNNVQFIPKSDAQARGWKYSDDGRTITVFEGDIPDAKSMRFALKTGIQLEYKLPGTSIDLIPGAFYNLAFTDVDNQDWKVNVFQISLDIRFAISYLK